MFSLLTQSSEPPLIFTETNLLDFNEEWTDEKLYAKYNLTSEEVEFIDSVIEDLGGENGGN